MAGSNSPNHDVSSSQLVINSNSAPELAFVVNPSEQTQVRFNCFSKTKLLSTIKRELSKADWNCLSKGCLDSVIRTEGNLTPYFQVVHQMLLHEVQTDKKKEMWFKVDGRLMRFSLLEFCCVSGLKCVEDNLHSGPPKHVSVFGFLGLHRCYLNDVIDIFVKTPKKSPKKLILAKWIIIEGVILPQRDDREVRDEFLSLACDRERFEHYAWGRKSYLHLIDSLKKVCRADTKSAVPRRGYNVFGYPLAFQNWIFEAIPRVPRALSCSFIHIESDRFSLWWVSNASIKEVRSEKARKVFETPLGTIHSLYAEFMAERHLCFIDEVADPIVDSFVKEFVDADERDGPSNSARKLRKRFYIIKAGRGNRTTELDPSAATRKGKTRGHPSDDAGDFEAPATKKPKHARGKFARKSTCQKTTTESAVLEGNEENVAISDEGCQPTGRQFDDELPSGDKNAPEPDLVSPVERQADKGLALMQHNIMEALKNLIQMQSSTQQCQCPRAIPSVARVSPVDQTANEDNTVKIGAYKPAEEALPDPAPAVDNDTSAFDVHSIEPTKEVDDTSVGVDPADKEAPSAIDGCGAEPTKVVAADENLVKEVSSPVPETASDGGALDLHSIEPTKEVDDTSVVVDPTDKESPSAVDGCGADLTKEVVAADENLAKEASSPLPETASDGGALDSHSIEPTKESTKVVAADENLEGSYPATETPDGGAGDCGHFLSLKLEREMMDICK